MFKKLFGKKAAVDNSAKIASPITGEVISIKEVNDQTFASEMLGKGAGIKPAEGKVIAPADGEITIVFPTKHAVSMLADNGAEILIHIGLDTVNLKGEHFTSHVEVGQKVKTGDLLLEFDVEKIAEAGYDTTSPVLVCNPDTFAGFENIKFGAVEAGEDIIKLTK